MELSQRIPRVLPAAVVSETADSTPLDGGLKKRAVSAILARIDVAIKLR
jgi:hypothetical protein